ncbi:MAG: ATP-binding protein [Oligoflexia bacterium]|nr:ATP-binding protein [Oligoflexia bacterium]
MASLVSRGSRRASERAEAAVAANKAESRAERELADFKRALDLSAIVAVTDRRGTIVYVNDKFCEISKYPREELLGKTHRVINSGFHPREFFTRMWGTISRGEVWRGEICNRAKDGGLYWVSTTIVPFLGPDGAPVHYIAIRFDITDRKRAEGDNERARQKAEDEVRLRENLMAVVSHDLKNPLSAIAINSAMIEREAAKAGLSHIRIQAERIGRATKRMRELIGDLLDFVKIRERTLRLEPRPLEARELLKDVGELFEPLARQKGVSLRWGTETAFGFTADPGRLLQVFSNVVGNALKFTPQGGRILIRGEEVAGRVRFSVSDTGPGIPREYLERIFDRFWQARDTASQGSGLGLSIARGIVQAHGGRIWAESEPGQGTVIRFELPRTPELRAAG